MKFQLTQIAEHYQPAEKLAALRTAKNLSTLESKALTAWQQHLKEKAGIPWSAIGISGSIMAGLTNEKSDIDPLVYGVENSRKAYAALQELLKTEGSGFKPYSQDGAANALRLPFERHPDELRRLRQRSKTAKPSKACSWEQTTSSAS